VTQSRVLALVVVAVVQVAEPSGKAAGSAVVPACACLLVVFATTVMTSVALVSAPAAVGPAAAR